MEGSTVVEPTQGLARNALGLPQVLFCIVTGAAPIAAMLFNDSWAVFGGGWAAPSAFIMATVAFTVFSVGYVAMARRVTAAGGFYSFASHGFGQSDRAWAWRCSSRLVTLIFSAGVTGVTAYFANTTINDWFGVDIPVWVFEFGTLAVMVMFAFFHIELTAKILGLLPRARADRAADVRLRDAVPARSTASCSSSLLPWNFFDSDGNGAEGAFGAGTVGAGLFGAFWSWIGFEMAPNYAEESKDPKRIMGPATYISVIGLGVLYTFICWMLVVAYGKNGIIRRRHTRSSTATSRRSSTRRPTASSRSTSAAPRLLTRAFELTIVTGSFACQLAFFNTATRYLFSMGREGVLPDSARSHASDASRARTSRASLVGVLCALDHRPASCCVRLEHARRAAQARHLGAR